MPPESDAHPTKEELLTATRRIVIDRETKEAMDEAKRRSPKKPVPKQVDWSSQGALVFGGALGLIVVLFALFAVCRASNRVSKEPITTESLIPATVKYGGQDMQGKTFVGMETTRTLKDEQLVAEIKQIADAKGMPADVFADDVPSEMNVASELSKQFNIYKDNPGELNKLRSGISGGEWKINEETLKDKNISDVLTRSEAKRQDIRSMLERKDVCFAFEFTPSGEGSIPDTDGADFMEDYVLLEEYAIARSLYAGKVDDALESLAYIFRMAQLAAEVRSPEVRSKAAKLRRHALDIAQTIVLDSNFRRENLEYLYEIIKEQLETWTNDAEAWIGDRATGLKVYNLIARYGPEEALEPNEIDELRQRGILMDAVPEAAPRVKKTRSLLFRTKTNDPPKSDQYGGRLANREELVKDQIYYLRMMRSVIEESKKPFYQRHALLNRIFDESRRLRNTPEEPIVAGLLLRGIANLMEYIAFDRAECEVALLAMSVSLKHPASTDQLELDPLFGKKYETRRMQNPTEPKIPIVQAAYSNSLKPFRVPDYSSGE